MSGVRVQARAKINLSLHVLAREASGFHQIETLFQRVALADIVTVREATTPSLDVRFGDPAQDVDLGPVEQNLAWRAATAYARLARWPRGFAIEIEKWIPVGGGLGGGSADAAAVLRALDALAPRPLGTAALVEIAGHLGADVAFLTSPAELALGWGRGERLLQLPSLPVTPVLLVIPDFGINTQWAYGELARVRAAAPPPLVAKMRTHRGLATWDAVAADAVNDFETVVFEHHPVLETIRARLAALPGSVLARMSGSGSTLYAIQAQDAGRNTEKTPPLGLPANWRALHTETSPERAVEHV